MQTQNSQKDINIKVRNKQMKLIVAYVQPHKLQDIKTALFEADVKKLSVTNALGCGAQQGYEESYRGVKFEVNLLKKVRIEIAVNQEYVDKTVEAICKGARTGNIGDGKIFVVDLDQCIRIRTGEKGSDAIG
jgi:nitrogen regulatory protein P-II 2